MKTNRIIEMLTKYFKSYFKASIADKLIAWAFASIYNASAIPKRTVSLKRLNNNIP